MDSQPNLLAMQLDFQPTSVPLDKILQRAIDTVHKIYRQYRKQTWNTFVIKFEDHGPALALFVDDDHSFKGMINGWFAPSFDHLLENQDDKNAVLMMQCCIDSIACTRKLLNELLADVDVAIHEVAVHLKTPLRKVITVWSTGVTDTNACAHTILRITLHQDGMMWAVDITGAQYYQSQLLKPWNEYIHEHVKKVGIFRDLGISEQSLRMQSKLQGQFGLDAKINLMGLDHLHASADVWMKESNMGLAKMVSLPDDEQFFRSQLELLEVLAKGVTEFVKNSDFEKARLEAEEWDEQNPEGEEHKLDIWAHFNNSSGLKIPSSVMKYSQFLKMQNI